MFHCNRFLKPTFFKSRGLEVSRRCVSQELEKKYSNEEKEKILKIINDPDLDTLSRYSITKKGFKSLSQWRASNGKINSLTDLEVIEGFSDRFAKKLFDSILNGSNEVKAVPSKIKGQILHPHLSEAVRESCKTTVAVYVTVNSVCWCEVDRSRYEVKTWKYHSIDYPDGKRLLITDIMDIAWTITQQIPTSDIYVMKAEATSLRAAGSDPNNPKVIAVNLQKAQMVAMIVALINSRDYQLQRTDSEEQDEFRHKVYFLRPTLPFRLYGTLIGSEKVSTDQTIEMLLQNMKGVCPNQSHVYMSDELMNMFRRQMDLQKDMLGHCLLLALTFMDICIYKNQKSIEKLTKRGG